MAKQIVLLMQLRTEGTCLGCGGYVWSMLPHIHLASTLQVNKKYASYIYQKIIQSFQSVIYLSSCTRGMGYAQNVENKMMDTRKSKHRKKWMIKGNLIYFKIKNIAMY